MYQHFLPVAAGQIIRHLLASMERNWQIQDLCSIRASVSQLIGPLQRLSTREQRFPLTCSAAMRTCKLRPPVSNNQWEALGSTFRTSDWRVWFSSTHNLVSFRRNHDVHSIIRNTRGMTDGWTYQQWASGWHHDMNMLRYQGEDQQSGLRAFLPLFRFVWDVTDPAIRRIIRTNKQENKPKRVYSDFSTLRTETCFQSCVQFKRWNSRGLWEM